MGRWSPLRLQRRVGRYACGVCDVYREVCVAWDWVGWVGRRRGGGGVEGEECVCGRGVWSVGGGCCVWRCGGMWLVWYGVEERERWFNVVFLSEGNCEVGGGCGRGRFLLERKVRGRRRVRSGLGWVGRGVFRKERWGHFERLPSYFSHIAVLTSFLPPHTISRNMNISTWFERVVPEQ